MKRNLDFYPLYFYTKFKLIYNHSMKKLLLLLLLSFGLIGQSFALSEFPIKEIYEANLEAKKTLKDMNKTSS